MASGGQSERPPGTIGTVKQEEEEASIGDMNGEYIMIAE